MNRARIWLDEAPSCALGPLRSTSLVLAPGAEPILRARATVELMVPRGAYIAYALLGLSVSEDRELRVEIPEGVPDRGVWESPLAVAQEVDAREPGARIGLPREYVPGVREGLLAVAEGAFAPARIRVSHAAHGLVGSSVDTFELVTRIAARILVARDVSDAALAGIVERARVRDSGV